MSLEVAVKTEPKVSLQRPRFEEPQVIGNPIPWFWALTPKVNFLPAVLSFLPSSQTAAASGRAFVQTGEGTPSSRKTSQGYPVSAPCEELCLEDPGDSAEHAAAGQHPPPTHLEGTTPGSESCSGDARGPARSGHRRAPR